MTSTSNSSPGQSWYRDIGAYQWLVLLLASAGWIFDVYEGQIFNLTRDDLLSDVLQAPKGSASVKQYGDVFLGIFLVGGAAGGIGFGALADRWGRRPTLVVTILTYSVFSGLTYFATELWQVGVLRFLVALGVGGEWSVAASLVAEVFAGRARTYAGSIFHASSVVGTWLAGWAALAIGTQWRYAYLIGVAPALLVVAIRAGVSEPKTWQQSRGATSFGLTELLTSRIWLTRAILGLLLASVGLGTFWGVTVAGQDLTQHLLLRQGVEIEIARERAKFAYGIVQATGGGLGLLAFGPLASRFGRRRTFIGMQLAALVVVPLVCFAPTRYWHLLVLLPLYGFCTLGIHAGFAIYFPELFPTRLRATATGFCFNGGRLVAASVLVFSGWLKARPGMDLRLAVTLLSGLFLTGIVFAALMPETRDQPLPE